MKNLTQQLVNLAQHRELHILLKEVAIEIQKENDPGGNQIASILIKSSDEIEVVANTLIEYGFPEHTFFGINSEVIN